MVTKHLVSGAVTGGALLLAGCASGPQGPHFESGSAAAQAGGHAVELVSACDFTGDGRSDFVVSGTTRKGQQRTTVLATGSGRFTEELTLERGFDDFASADLDNDGHCDFVGLTGGQGQSARSDYRVFFGAEGGRFPGTLSRSARPGYPRALATGDVDGDDTTDVVVFYKAFNGETDTVVFPGSPDRGQARQPTHHRLGATAVDGVATDLDGDGDVDLAALGLDRRIHLLANRAGRLTRESTRAYDQPAEAGKLDARMVTGDFDGDGDADLAVADTGVHRVFLFNGDTRPAMAATYRFPSSSAPRGLAAADLDGDGADDLVVLRQSADGPLLTALQVSSAGSSLTFRNTGKRWVEDLDKARRIELANLDEAGGPDAVVWGSADGEPWMATIRDLRIEQPTP